MTPAATAGPGCKTTPSTWSSPTTPLPRARLRSTRRRDGNQPMAAHSQPPAASTVGAFDQSHAGRMRSAAVETIYRSAFGQDYPAAAQPNAFYSATTLQRVISTLDLRPGRVLADLGCGHGGPGLWAAQQTGATLIGIDLSPAGVELARRRVAQLGLDRRASFATGDLAATGLPDASCDVVMSLDVL